MENTIIVTTPGELQGFISNAVREALQSIKRGKNGDAVASDNLTINEAVEYLRELGQPLSRPTLYSLVSRELVPYRKIGTRVAFSRTELAQWVADRTKSRTAPMQEAGERIARTACKQLGVKM